MPSPGRTGERELRRLSRDGDVGQHGQAEAGTRREA